jgi:hypothetical protein
MCDKMPFVDQDEQPGQDQLWRVAKGQRIGSVVVSVVWVALAVGITVGGGVATGVIVILWCVVPLMMLMAWRYSFVPYVAMTPTAAVVRNRVGQTTIPYADIAEIRPGYYGTTIKRRSGGAVVAWAVQKPSWATWSKKGTRADDLADAIRRRVAEVPYAAQTGHVSS